MNALLESQIELLLKDVTHLYPRLELPTDKSQWDVGHNCLAFLDKSLPLNTLMLHSYFRLICAQCQIGMRHLSAADVEAWRAIYMPAYNRQLQFWNEVHTKNATLSNLKKYRTAGCGELSVVACHWLREHGVNAYRVNSFFWTGKAPDEIHQFVLYTLPNTPKLSYAEMMQNLTNPNVRVVDVWFQKCGTVQEMVNHYANTMVLIKDKEFLPVHAGLKMIMRGPEFDSDLYHVGVVSDKGQVKLYQKPSCFCLKNKQRVDISAYSDKIRN